MSERTLYDWFTGSVAQHPDACALEVADARLSYRELDLLVRHLAVDITRTLGAVPARVGVHANRSLTAYVAYLAAQRLGATAVPLNPSFPRSRRVRVAALADVDLVVAQEKATYPVPVLVAEDDALLERVGRPAPEAPVRAARAADVAYTLFTSGSTGVPKGVPIRHSNVDAYLGHVIPRYGLGPGERVSQTFDLTFDLSVFDLFATWGSGATLVVPTRRELLAPARFVAARRITHWFSVPSVISMALRLGRLPEGGMPGLRWSLFCGERLTLEQARAWRAAAPGSVLENLYGPTELTLSCTQFRLPEAPGDWPRTVNGTVPIGTPYPGLEHLVIDDRGAAATRGELCVRGPQRFAGYLDPAHNRHRFLRFDGVRATPADAGPRPAAELWYRTGDLVTETDRVLVHLGRADHQVKVQGYRVELGEIEAELRRQDGVEDAIVVALTEPDSGPVTLHAVCTGANSDTAGLLAALRERLPAHMLPRDVVHWARLPLNPNGKVDRAAIVTRLDPD
ncbi:AMP-binding protein [Streptomyces sp. R08]|uniref:AMP-binding protein n=1 Tax=Streptomyces sp. R08 TaxID=3238624 RepID=A0AB39M8I2_9ACTN